METHLYSIRTGKWELGSFCSNMIIVLHFRLDLILIMPEDSMRNQISTGALQETSHITWIFSYGSYVSLLLEVMWEFEVQFSLKLRIQFSNRKGFVWSKNLHSNSCNLSASNNHVLPNAFSWGLNRRFPTNILGRRKIYPWILYSKHSFH